MTMSVQKSVRATMQYTVDNGVAPDYYFYEPEPSVKLNPPGTDPREVEIHDAWPRVAELSADREGFELHDFDSRFDQFDDDASVHAGFYPQVVDFVKKHTGARRVVVFDHTVRKRLPADLKQQTTVQRPAVMLVHSDYTPASGPQRVRDVVPDDAEDLLQARVAFYNVWKPLYRRVDELPLAMIDAQTQDAADLLRMDLKYRERTGEIYVMRYSARHRWHYFPHMEPSHALILKTYDSEMDGRARFMGHSAFEDPTSPLNAPRRESIEVRTMAFF
ncbi:MAG: methyltransferase [Bacteriovorax sp.]|nr:methyltransferase [Rhizobacter sp.]